MFTKEEAIKILRRNEDVSYAELTVDVYSGNNVIYPDEKIIVILSGKFRDFYFIGKCYCTCNDIDDFDLCCVFGRKEAEKYLTKYYIGDIKKISLF